MERDTILVIDDDPDFREAVRLLLEALGASVLEAPDCTAGIALLGRERSRVRVVLLDYWMPGKTPRDCARCLHELAGKDVEVVLVTAAANPAERAAELGIARYLSKPFEIEQLERLTSPDAPSPGARSPGAR
jgi:CheY-like chemotaxis protein